MKIRIILVVLSLLSISIITLGGFFYYREVKGEALRNAYTNAQRNIEGISYHFDLHLDHDRMLAELIGGFKEIRDALALPDSGGVYLANKTLDYINRTMSASVTYLLDKKGNTIASSNRNDPDSFMGKNYSFRPYFSDAMNNKAVFYIARGVTSKKLGIYISYPVHTGKDQEPSGVVVIKMPLENLVEDILKGEDGLLSIVDQNGFILVSNRKDMDYKFLWEPDPRVLDEFVRSRQFGEGPFRWAGFMVTGEKMASDQAGNLYGIHESAIKNILGWKIIYLHSYNDINTKISRPIFLTTGFIILFLCMGTAVAVTFLYNQASFEIKKRMNAEDALKRSLDEKEMLIKEIHHRVKNNLMIIESLLMLQMGQVKDEESKGLFIESQNRVRSISLIHEKLYMTEDARDLNLSEYISTLTGEIFSNYQVKANWIKLDMNVPDIKLDIDTMIPCGLLINELISNTFKHAFPNGREGVLAITMEELPDNEILLDVKDNGVGLPAGFDINTTESMGMQIINSLVHQINGKLEIIRNNGTEFHIIFKERSFKKKSRDKVT